MTETEIAVASGATVALIQVLKMAGLSGRWAYIASAGVSALTMVVFGVTRDALTRQDYWSLYIAYPVILSSAAGVFNLVASAPTQVAAFRSVGTAIGDRLSGRNGGLGIWILILVCGWSFA